jgi:hypothetical protein
MAEQYRNGPDPSVERPAIGRRSSECQMDCANLIIPGAVKSPSCKVTSRDQLPSSDELIKSVAEFLREEVMPETEGRVNFLARVAANSLEIVRRENSRAPSVMLAELQRLSTLSHNESSNEAENELSFRTEKPSENDTELTKLKWHLVEDIRNAKTPLSNEALQNHLRQSVYDQLSVDQPNYPAFISACVTEN